MENKDVSAVLRDLRERSGLSIRAVAAHLDCSPSAYHHYETRYKKPYLPIEMVERLSGLFASKGIDPADLFALAGIDRADRVVRSIESQRGFGESDLVHWAGRNEFDEQDPAVAALYPGNKNADLWEVRTPALEMEGYRIGDIVIVDLSLVPVTGDVVCAQVYNWQNGTAETLLRIYEPPYIVAASVGRKYRRPEFVDNERVLLKGVVVASFRRRAQDRQILAKSA